MIVYYIVYLMVAIISTLTPRLCFDLARQRKIICTYVFLILFVVLACRHPSMGIDLNYGDAYGYLGQYLHIANMTWREAFTETVGNYERGYILFNKLASCISKEPQFLIASCAFFSLLPVFYMINRMSDAPNLSIYIYIGLPVFMMLFSGMRQDLALGLCCLALTFIVDKKPLQFITTVLVASSFHSTAMIYLIAYPIYHWHLSKEMRVLTLFLFPVLYVFRYQIFLLLSRLIREDAVPDNNGAITLFLVFCLIYIFGILYTDGKKEESGLLNLFFIACCCQALAGVYSTALRIGYYFLYPTVIFLPRMIKRNTNYRDSFILTVAIGACFIAFGIYAIKTTYWAMAYPYRFFWQ